MRWGRRRLRPPQHSLTDAGSLRDYVHSELGLPPSQSVRLKCGTRDLRDHAPLSDVHETIHVMLSGGLSGGAPKRRRVRSRS